MSGEDSGPSTGKSEKRAVPGQGTVRVTTPSRFWLEISEPVTLDLAYKPLLFISTKHSHPSPPFFSSQ